MAISALEEKVKTLEASADIIAQRGRRANLVFTGIPEAVTNEEYTDEIIINTVNSKMEVTPPLTTMTTRGVFGINVNTKKVTGSQAVF